jgi:hypothetical protein
MKPLKITINKTSYSMKFGMACLMRLSRLWKTNTINETTEKLSVLETALDGNPSIELIQVLSDLVWAAILTEKSNDLDKFDPDDLLDVLFNDSKLLQAILLDFMESMPRGEGKKKPTSKK